MIKRLRKQESGHRSKQSTVTDLNTYKSSFVLEGPLSLHFAIMHMQVLPPVPVVELFSEGKARE